MFCRHFVLCLSPSRSLSLCLLLSPPLYRCRLRQKVLPHSISVRNYILRRRTTISKDTNYVLLVRSAIRAREFRIVLYFPRRNYSIKRVTSVIANKPLCNVFSTAFKIGLKSMRFKVPKIQGAIRGARRSMWFVQHCTLHSGDNFPPRQRWPHRNLRKAKYNLAHILFWLLQCAVSPQKFSASSSSSPRLATAS